MGVVSLAELWGRLLYSSGVWLGVVGMSCLRWCVGMKKRLGGGDDCRDMVGRGTVVPGSVFDVNKMMCCGRVTFAEIA